MWSNDFCLLENQQAWHPLIIVNKPKNRIHVFIVR